MLCFFINKNVSTNGDIMYDQKSSLKYRSNNKNKLNTKQRQKYQELKKKNEYVDVITKVCSSCLQNLPKENFKNLYSSKDGLTYTCRECINKNNTTKKNNL